MPDLSSLTDDDLREQRRAARADLDALNAELASRVPPVPTSAPRIGGSFAPPLTATKVKEYRKLAESARPGVKAEVLKLCDLYDLFHQTPASTAKGSPHPSGRGTITPLAAAEVKRIWDAVPWNDAVPGDHANEVEALARLFDGIDPAAHKPLRDAAFHLLWYAAELANDREPLTADRL